MEENARVADRGIPTTPLMARYEGLRQLRGNEEGLLEQHLRLAREANENPAELVDQFAESVETAATFFADENARDEGFFGSPREPLGHEPGLSKTAELGALFQAQGDRLWEASVDGEDLSFRYLDRELVVTQARGLQLASGAVSSRGPRIDLLLASADGTPIIGEAKVGGDSSAYLALIQVLAAAGYLLPPRQSERLRHHDPAGHLGSELERFDLYLVAAQELENSEIRREILAETNRLSAALLDKGLSRFVRRIAAIKLEATFDSSGVFAHVA